MESWVLLQGPGLGGKERETCSCQDRGEGDAVTAVPWPPEFSFSEGCHGPQSAWSNEQKAAATPSVELEGVSAPDCPKEKLSCASPGPARTVPCPEHRNVGGDGAWWD